MARNICCDVGKGPLVGLCVLKGGYQFFGDLMDRIRTINASGGEKKFCLFFSMHVLHSNISFANFMQYFTVSPYPFYDLNKNRNISSHRTLSFRNL